MVSKLRAQQWLPPGVSRKARKQNFLPSEIAVLTEKVEKNLSVIQSKLTNGITTQKKNDIWIKIADAVNAVQPPKSAKSGKACIPRPRKNLLS